MTRVEPIRLLLLAGAAATAALLVRGPLAARIGRTIDAPVHELAAAAQSLRPAPPLLKILPRHDAPPRAIVPMLPTPGEPSPPSAKGGGVPAAAAKPMPSAPKAHVVTRAELDDALANRLSGARAVLVRDEAGRPAGLALHGVAPLARFGVRDGDVLVSANGLSLRSPDEALAALGSLEHAKRVVVTLRRGGLAYSVPVELAD